MKSVLVLSTLIAVCFAENEPTTIFAKSEIGVASPLPPQAYEPVVCEPLINNVCSKWNQDTSLTTRLNCISENLWDVGGICSRAGFAMALKDELAKNDQCSLTLAEKCGKNVPTERETVYEYFKCIGGLDAVDKEGRPCYALTHPRHHHHHHHHGHHGPPVPPGPPGPPHHHKHHDKHHHHHGEKDDEDDDDKEDDHHKHHDKHDDKEDDDEDDDDDEDEDEEDALDMFMKQDENGMKRPCRMPGDDGDLPLCRPPPHHIAFMVVGTLLALIGFVAVVSKARRFLQKRKTQATEEGNAQPILQSKTGYVPIDADKADVA